MADDPELEAIKRKREEELQRRQQGELQQAQIEAQKQSVLRNILTDDARQRLANIKLAKPEYASMLENQLISLASSRRLSGKITDQQLKQMLSQLLPKDRERKIRIKRK